MNARSVILDSNLLILFVVGAASREYVRKHKRLTEFTLEDFDTLVDILSRFDEILVTPNTATETSNLAAHIAEPARSEIRKTLRRLLSHSKESYVASRDAADQAEYVRLGITDAALLEVGSANIALLTADLDLHLSAKARGISSVNFHHIRERHV